MKTKFIILFSFILSLTANSQTWTVFGYDALYNECATHSHITIFKDTLWSGLSKLDGTTLTKASAPAQLFSCDLSKSDQNGNLWLVGSINKDTWHHGDAYTIYKFDGSHWYDYSPPTSIGYHGCSSIAFQSDGKIWFTTTDNGAYMYDGTTWVNYKSFVFHGANAMAIDKSGTKWFATSNNGLVKLDSISWTVFDSYINGVKFNVVNDIAIDKNGDMWLATGSFDEIGDTITGRIAKFDGTNWTYYKPFNDGEGLNSVYTVEVDPNGRIWAGTLYGLTFFDGVKWTNYTDSHTSTDNLQVLSIDFDSQGNIWFGTMCGILKLQDYTASVNSPYSQNIISVGPNPANSFVNISLSGQNSNMKISVLDSKGSLVLKKAVPSNSVQLNISDFQQGLYFIRVNTGSNRIIRKIIKYN